MHRSTTNPDRPLSDTAGRRAAFTLIELLGVIGIIAVLLGIVLSAIETVHRYSRKAVAQVEVRTIEDAWKRYFDHYNRWPTNTSGIASYLGELSSEGVYDTYRIDASVGNALEGRTEDDEDARRINPEGVHFMEFSRYGMMADDRRTPVNPWYRGLKLAPGDSNAADAHSKFFYYVRLDVNANNRTSLNGIEMPARLKAGEDAVSRSVIVWTVNPDDADDFIASWSR